MNGRELMQAAAMMRRGWIAAVFALLAASLAVGEEIPLVKQGGVYTLPVRVNNAVTLNFILDSGASEVIIPAGVALRLHHMGALQKDDFLPGRTYVLADGSKLKSPRFNVESMRIGRREISDVTAAITPAGGSLLLGQSLLEKLGVWSFDHRRKVLILQEEETKPKPRPRPKPASAPVTLSQREHGNLSDAWPSLKRQAALHMQSGKYDQAESHLEKVLKIQESLLGPRDRRIPETVSMLIEAYEEQGKQDEADALNDWAASVWGQR